MTGLAIWPEQDERDPFGEAFTPPSAVARETFRQFVTRVRPGFQWYQHAATLADVLQRVADGELRRVIVEMPPRHGKSEEVSRLFPAYYLTRYPAHWVGLASYGAELAYTLSRAARGNYQLGGGRIREDAAAVKHWETLRGGGLWAAGVGGPATGKGLHLGVVDDWVKDGSESQSEAIGRRNREWWLSTFTSRAEPDAALVVVGTRWPGPGDLVGWLFEQEGTEAEAPEHWHVVAFEALKEAEPQEIPATCTLEPDPREPGAALCPERYPRERLLQIQARSTPYWWHSLYQQRPRAREGATFKREWFPAVDTVPVGRDVRYWDHAATASGGDYSVGTRMRKASDGNYYVLDVVRGQWASGERDRIIRRTAELDGAGVAQWAQQEPGSAGKDAALAFRRLLDGFAAHTEPATGSKEVRADPFAAAASSGFVRLVRGAWNKAWLDEVCDFPFGKHDDQVDTASGAYTKLARPAGTPLPLSTSYYSG